MSPQAFRDALAGLGMTQAGFARFLAEHGHPAKDVARSVRRWAEIGPPGEAVVILALLRGLRNDQAAVEQILAETP